jgi:signal transduction histidine kinase
MKGASYWMKNDFDSAIYFYRKAFHHAVEGDLKGQSINVLSNIALAFKTLSEIDSTIIYYNKSIDFSRESGRMDMMARNMISLSYVYSNQGNYVQASKLLFEAKKISDDLGNHTLLSLVHSALGYLYNYLNSFDDARKNFLLSVYHDSLENESYISHNNFFNLGEMYWYVKKDIDSARFYLQKGLESASLAEKERYRQGIKIISGNYFMDQQQYDSAISYYEDVKNLHLIDRDVMLKTAVFVNLGYANFYLNKLDKAKEFFDLGYQSSVKNNMLQNRLNALKGLIMMDSVKGNLDSAYFKLKEFLELEKAAQREEARNKLAQIEIEKDLELIKLKYDYLEIETELKTRRIDYQKWLIYIVMFLLLGSTIFTIVQIKNHRKILRLNDSLLTKQGELKELINSKNKFISVLSHDLKSPFSGLLGLMEMLSTEWKSIEDDEKHEIVQMLYNSSLSTYRLLDELLLWSKSQQGLIKPKAEMLNILSVAEEVLSLLQNAIRKKDIRLKADIPPEKEIIADHRLLSQIIQNFVNNAIKYTPRGGTIRLFVTEENERICLAVEDSGIGIPEDKIGSIFNLDCDFNRPGTENEKSTGMGLILCQEYARIMNAELKVESVVNQGSTFSIVFRKENNS